MKLNHVLRKTERLYYQQELQNSQNNLRKSWTILKSIINKNKNTSQSPTKVFINGKLNENSTEIANHFNTFFTEVGPNLDKKIPRTNTDPIKLIPGNYTINLFLNPVTEDEVSKMVSVLKDCAVGWDFFPAFIFKENKQILNKLLTHLINLSLEQGVFPSQLKIANIVPIFKAGEIEIVGNYRPVSLLSTVSKVFERAFFN